MFRFLLPALVVLLIMLPGSVHAATLIRPPNNLGLQAYWSFDEGTGSRVQDLSGRGMVGTAVNGPSWITGKYGKALSLASTSSQYVAAPSGFSDFSSGLTISVWANPTSSGSWARFVDFGNGSSNNNVLLARNGTSNDLTFEVYAGGVSGGKVTATNGIINNTWHLYTVTEDAAGNVVLYRDGVQLQTGTSAVPTTITRTLNYIGRSNWAVDSYYSGGIDNTRVYNRALSATEVASLYSKGLGKVKNVTRSGLVGEWLFNEGSGTRVKDSSGSGNTGTLGGSAGWTTGRHGKAVSIVPSSSVTMSTANKLPTSVITVSAWVRLNTNKNWNNIVRKNWTAAAGTWLLYTDATGAVKFGVYDTGQKNSFSPAGAVTTGKWYHLVGTYDGTNVNVYVNGVVGTSVTTSSPQTLDTSTTGFDIGNTADGAIDDVRIYNRVLSTDEIKALYQERAVSVNTSQNGKLTNGLVGLWSFDGADMQGTTAYDRSGQGNNGSIVGAPVPTIGKIGQGISIAPGGNYVNIPSSTTFDSSYVTVSAWVKHPDDTSGNTRTAVSRWFQTADANGEWILGTGSIPSAYRFLVRNGIGIFSAQTTTGYAANTWNHLVGVYDGATTKLYVNGVLVATSGNTTSLLASPGSVNVRIGRRDNDVNASRDWSGNVDDVRIYNRALSDAEIKQLYLMGK